MTKFNGTNFVCTCDKFGFLALVPPPTTGRLDQWPPPAVGSGPQLANDGDLSDPLADGARHQLQAFDATNYVGANQANKFQQQQQQVGLLTSVFIFIGVTLLVLSTAAFVAKTVIRAAAQSRLGQKQQSFLNGGPTTGPLAADHNLLASDPLVVGGAGAASQSTASIIGLANAQPTAAGTLMGAYGTESNHYKAHQQQLYAAHLSHSPLGAYSTARPAGNSNKLLQFAEWLSKPSRWLARLSSAAGDKSDSMIHHRVISTGGHSTLASHSAASLGYKSHFQNGYTTSLGLHNNRTLISQQQPTTAATTTTTTTTTGGGQSSNSSYVSSSAYYEEIGPGNLTKVSSSQLSGATSGAPTHTLVDPFKRNDQQHLFGQRQHHHHNHHQHHQHHHQLPQHQGQWPAGGEQVSYSLEPSQQQQQHLAYGQPTSMAVNPTLGKLGQSHNNNNQNDLSPLQSSSSSSSAGSQHSPATSVTTANGSTPRHYLFASPSAVSAYKQQQHQFRGTNH